MINKFYENLKINKSQGKKMLALLVDPDKLTEQRLESILEEANKNPGPDVILVGGSLVFNGVESLITKIKSQTKIPVFLFPGSALQVSKSADGILLLSLISGRNPDFLIGHHVMTAPALFKSGIEVIPTGYILIDGGTSTSVSYMSNTMPVPASKIDIALATAMAGELLGLKQLYLEAGSGAKVHVPINMIKTISREVQLPVWVGGGIRDGKTLHSILQNGADVAVIGTAFEQNPDLLSEFCNIISDFNQTR